MKNKDWQIFIQLLKEIAEEKGVTQQEISEKTGYSQPNISRIFSMRYTPRLDVFLAIAEAVGVNFFFEDKDGNGIGLNAVAILIDMAKWTWEALMRTETTLKTESLPLRFAHVISLAGEKLKLLREHTEATCASLLIT